MFRARLRRLRETLARTALDAFLVSNPYNIYYLTGFTGGLDGEQFFLIVTPDEAILPVDSRYLAEAKDESVVDVVEWKDRTMKGIADYVPAGVGNLGFEAESITFACHSRLAETFADAKLVPQSKVVEALRMHKTEVEVDSMSAAAAIADAAFEHIVTLIEPGVPERDVAMEIEYFMRKRGAEREGFGTIVASGKRSAMPHARASGKPIGAGDLVVIDLGARFQGYCSDMTRTVVVGEPTRKQKEIFDVVLKAQETALDAVKPGVSCKDVDDAARRFIDEEGYGKFFGHGLGHGVGLEVHERPSLSQKSTDVLEEGMVVTIEPGIYIEGLGGARVEDLVLVTRDGKKILSRSPKLLLEL